MKQPQGIEDPQHPNFVCRLKQLLYCLKQAPRAWNSKFTGYLPYLGSNTSLIKEVIIDLDFVFELKDMGQLSYFLGLQISYQSNRVPTVGKRYLNSQSQKQGSVSHSSTEAKYRALVNTSADIVWIRQVLADLHEFLPEPPMIHCDNMSALALCSNLVFHSRIKHRDIDYHFVRERVQRKDILVQCIQTNKQVADVFTKGLRARVFSQHCINLRLGNPN
ncbi:unnamed protein product [Prunus armeniaca]